MSQKLSQGAATLEIDPRLLDFRNFVLLAWKFLNLPPPTPRQLEIAEWMQYGPKRLQVHAFRGEGKSILAEVFFCWCLYLAYAAPKQCRPEYSLLAVSAAGARAYNFSTFVINLILQWDLLKHLRPRSDGRTSKIQFDVGLAPVQDSPSVRSLGITGQLQGIRANTIVMDDVEAMNNSDTQLQREKLSRAMTEVDAILKPLDDAELGQLFPHLPLKIAKQIAARVIVLGTPQTEETVYNELVGRGYQKRIWPARYPGPKWMQTNGAYLAPKIAEDLENDPGLAAGGGIDAKQGQVTDKRFGELDLVERELSYGRSGFALQFMLDTSLADADRYPLKIRDLIVMDLDPDKAPEKLVWCNDPDRAHKDLECVGFNGDRYFRPLMISDQWASYQGTVMAVDPAGRGKDECSIAVVKMLNSNLFAHHVKGFGPGAGYEDTVLQEIADVAKNFGVNKIVVESNFGDGMFTKLLTPYLRRTHNVSIEEVRSSIQKEKRIIDTLEPVLNSHRLIVDPSVIRRDGVQGEHLSASDKLRYQLMYQLSRITREKGALLHDDRLDVLAMAVSYWTEQMALDADLEMQHRRNAALEQSLREHMAAYSPANVSRYRQPTWINRP